MILLFMKAVSIIIDFFIIATVYLLISPVVNITIASLSLFENDPISLFITKGILTAGVATSLICIKRVFLHLP